MMQDRFAERIVNEARYWVGTPYVHQASVHQRGCDCLGLVRGIWRNLNGDEPEKLPAYTLDWGEVSEAETILDGFRQHFEEISCDQKQPGDVLVFRWNQMTIAKHLGILVGNDRFIHAYEKSGVVETTLGRHWGRRIAAVFRFPRS